MIEPDLRGPGNAELVRRVLVVDDDGDINRLLRTRLTFYGFEVESVPDGEQALERLASAPLDLMFLDVSMPGIDGLEVLRWVRERQLDLAVIMMTAFGSEQVAIEALRRGADDYLCKPFEPSEFQAVLQRTTTRLAMSRQNTALRRQLDEKRHQLQAELARAAQVQASLLPRDVPILPGFDLAARCIPAREVSGDFYDWLQPTPESLVISLGDVTGKGMSAALLMATVRAALRAAAHQLGPAMALELTGRSLAADLESSGSFVTLFQADLHVPTRRLTYSDAGHGYVFVVRADGTRETLGARELPLGIYSEEKYPEGTVTLEPNDTLIVYSDGLVEVWPELDDETVARQLVKVPSASGVVDRILELAQPPQPPPDDLTILVLRSLDTR